MDIVQEELLMPEKINVFISHYGGDEEYIEGLKKLISKNGDYEIRDSSIVESEPNKAKDTEYIKSIILKKIDWAGKIIVLIGPKTHERDWVNWEIEQAAKRGDKSIIGVFLQGATDADIPEALKKYGNACVAWNSDKIISAIEGEPIWIDSQGNIRPNNGLDRISC
jgi:hypothetical protein